MLLPDRFMRRSLLRLLVLMLFGCLGACGGGDNGAIGTATPGTGAKAAQVQGVWSGSLTIAGSSTSSIIFAVVTQGGDAFFFDQNGVLYVLPPVTGATTLTGDLTAFAPMGVVFGNGQSMQTFSVTAAVSASSIDGSFSGNGETGNFTLMPANPFNGNPSIVGGNWQGFEVGSGSAVDLTVQPGGVFVGNDADGCNLDGSLKQLQSGQDLFTVTLTSNGSNCPGRLNGLAFQSATDIADLFGGDQGIYYYIVVSNASGAFVAELKVQ